jgi:hypothetical protein
MSALIPVPGTIQKPTCVALSTTGITDIYTAVDNLDTVIAILITNVVAGAVDVVIDWFDGSTNNHIDAITFTAAKGSKSPPFDQPIRLLTGHKIKATASVANQITVTVIATKTMRNVASE